MPQSATGRAQRTNRAFRIAYLCDLARIHYTITLDAFCHSWAIIVLGWLIPSAYTVLEYLAALNRSNRYGYIGIAAAYKLLAPRIAQATHRKCSRRTLERGIACLKYFGLVELRPWTMPDYEIERDGKRIVVQKGTAKVETSDGWTTRQLRIIVLTDRALALWDKRTKSQAKRYMPQFPTPAKLADSSQVEQCVDTHMLESSPNNDVDPHLTCKTVLDCEPDKDPSSPACNSARSKGCSTWPDRPADRTGPTCEHEALTSKKLFDQIQNATTPPRPASAAPVSREPTPTPKPKGCSRPRPQVPRGTPQRTWNFARSLILREVHKALCDYSQRQANSIFDRAAWELGRDYPAGWQTSCDWPYWIGRFVDFTPAERIYHVKRDMLPLLRHPAAITPNEPRRYKTGRQSGPDQPDSPPAFLEVPADLPDLLLRLKRRFCPD